MTLLLRSIRCIVARTLVSAAVLLGAIGCANHPPESGPAGVAFVVPGAGGDGSDYNALRDELHRAGFGVRTHRWGAAPALFALNFSNQSIHDIAEAELVDRIHAVPGDTRVIVIGHSAGGGVALGAAGRLQHRSIDVLILLHPSVSPGYDLAPALAHVAEAAHHFHSQHDTTFLSWRTRNFGTYDRIKSPAAGNVGFASTHERLHQRAYDTRFRALGHAGGHWGPLARPFVREHVIPLTRPMAHAASDDGGHSR